MNCRRIEKLIPLYVEGDLNTELTEQVRSHAKSCANCSGLVAEYKESQRWLRSFEPPHFDDALLDELKLGVLEKINGEETHASFLNRMAQHWTRRLVFAASVALLMIFGALAYYTYQNSRHDLVADSEIEQEEQSPEIAAQPKDVEKAPRAYFSPKRRRHTGSIQRRLVAVTRPGKTSVEPAMAKEAGDGLSSDPATDQELLRIEIQTSDPNIRIIWFSPKENNSNPSRPITETE